MLVIRAIVRNPSYDFLWIVTPGRRTFRIGLVVLRLCQRARLRRSLRRLATWPEVGLRRLAGQWEIQQMISPDLKDAFGRLR